MRGLDPKWDFKRSSRHLAEQMKARQASSAGVRQDGAKTDEEERNTGCTNAKTYSRCSPGTRNKISHATVAAVRTFRPRSLPAAGTSYTRLSKRFDPECMDESMFANVHTLYKRKAQKVLPVNQPRLKSDAPGGEARWKTSVLEQEKEQLRDRPPSKWDKWLIPRFAQTPEGTRLTSKRLAKL